MNRRAKTGLFVLITFGVVVVAAFTAGELMIRFTRPVRTMYPRYRFIPEYGFGLFPGRSVVHSQPGRFEFHYTVNEYGYRGEAIPVAGRYDTHNVVVLGDSYTFGQGVDDGEPYAAVLGDLLGDDYAVVNLGSPGWGLTQEIRRYVDLGARYQPEVVVLQYCSNDPEDNLNHRVTTVENGEFVFHSSSTSTSWAKKYLSGSIIQKSQLYNFYRGRIYEWFQNRHVQQVAADLGETAEPVRTGEVTARERFYCELLDRFAVELERDGVHLIMISVEKQLDNLPGVESCVMAEQDAGRLEYVDLDAVFDGVDRGDGFYSPEGHWGPRAHRLVAQALAPAIERQSSARRDAPAAIENR